MREMKDSGIEWIGEIPKSWTITILSALFSERKCKNSGLTENNLLSLSYGNIVRKNIESNEGLLPASFETYNIIEPGNIVFRLTDLQNDKRSLRTGLCQERGIITSAYVTLQIRSDDSPRYMHYLFHTYDLCKVFYGMGDGVRQGMNYEDLKRLRILRPDRETQRRIANYLDRKCSQIDAIIARQQEVIEKLKAYKLSVITEAVTKGLNPNVPMKDSGVEWIGEIPEHWSIVPLTKQLESIVDYRGKTPEKVDDGIFLVTARNIKNGMIDYSISSEYVKAEDYDEIMRRGIPQIGDVLFTTEAPLGQVANVDRTDIALAQRIIKFSTKKHLDSYFLKYWIMSVGFQNFLMTLSTGSTAVGIKASKLFMLPVPLAPMQGQKQIVTYLDKKCERIESVIDRKQALIDRFTDYKKSLIYEVVTGKKEV